MINTVTNDPAPSLHPHYRGFVTTTSRSASRSRVGTRPLAVSAAWGTPSPPRHGGACRDLPSPVPCESGRLDSRRLHAGHHLANKRALARLIPGFWSHPGFDVVLIFFDTSAAIHLRSPFQSPPDASFDAFSSSLTTTVFSQRSMRRFGASPRRATPKGQTFISRTAPFSEAVLLPTPFHVQDTRPARSIWPATDPDARSRPR